MRKMKVMSRGSGGGAFLAISAWLGIESASTRGNGLL